MRRFFGALLLSGVLMAPVAMQADDHHDKRYYDRDRRDYHEWNDREDKAYRHWLDEQHHQYRSWNRMNSKEQRRYWKWRHDHPDFDR